MGLVAARHVGKACALNRLESARLFPEFSSRRPANAQGKIGPFRRADWPILIRKD
jgi:hypothetical protein